MISYHRIIYLLFKFIPPSTFYDLHLLKSKKGVYKNTQFTPHLLQTAGRDVCNGILSYFYKKEMIIIPKNEYRFNDKTGEEKDSQQVIRKSNSPIKLKIFNFEQENLLQEIEAVKEIENEGNEGFDNENDNGSVKSNKEDEQEVSDGSDSEPSLDNFDNDQLVKLLPSFPKKKSKIIYINFIVTCEDDYI